MKAASAPALTASLLALVMLIAVSADGIAHEQQAAVTTIAANPRTGQLEVVHRFWVHDVEHAARDLGWKDTDVLANQADQERFARYVAGHFALGLVHPAGQGSRPLDLALVGHELEGRYLWVYQESPLPVALDQLIVDNRILRSVWPQHHHLVNVILDPSQQNRPVSLVFTEGVNRLAVASRE